MVLLINEKRYQMLRKMSALFENVLFENAKTPACVTIVLKCNYLNSLIYISYDNNVNT